MQERNPRLVFGSLNQAFASTRICEANSFAEIRDGLLSFANFLQAESHGIGVIV